MKIAAAILAGGQSQRMGRDKANLPALDDAEMTLLRRTVTLAAAVFCPVYVVGRARPEDWEVPEAAAETLFLADDTPGLGPAGGLATVLRVLDAEHAQAVALIACDLPLLTLSALQWLHRSAAPNAPVKSQSHGLATRHGDQIEPLFSVYATACLPLLTAHLAEGRRSLQKLIEAGEFLRTDAPPEVSRTLLNVNTAEDLAQARSLAGALEAESSSMPA